MHNACNPAVMPKHAHCNTQALHTSAVVSRHVECNTQGHCRTHLSRQLNWRRRMQDGWLCCCCCCLLLVARGALMRAGGACRPCTSFIGVSANPHNEELVGWGCGGWGGGGGGCLEAGVPAIAVPYGHRWAGRASCTSSLAHHEQRLSNQC